MSTPPRAAALTILALAACAGGRPAASPGAAAAPLRVLVWSEGTAPRKVYPAEINGAVAEGLKSDPALDVRTAFLGDAGQGVTEEALASADVLVWWGHVKQDKVTDENTARVIRHVTERGMGFIGLHSAHYSRPLTGLLGAPGHLGGWRNDGKPERVSVVAPDHPIARGVEKGFVIPAEEMYAEPFVVPPPDELVFISSFAEGEVFRSGCCWRRGKGRVFYFRPGHETHPTYFDPNVRRVIRNAVYWAAGRPAPG